ncbi:CapA family protein [Metabacillus fastidiosus]|uniref:CapA family protein n=1 Tax=Metabacillus fastidiosus TaxID=1458 RepID=UPI002E1F3A42|nr:CapA family protein [Metabacillus fastidiosus]
MNGERSVTELEPRAKRRRRRLKRSVRRFLFFIFLIVVVLIIYNNMKSEKVTTEIAGNEQKDTDGEVITHEKKSNNIGEKAGVTETELKISAAGDFTLGTDESFPYQGSFVHEASVSGLPHFVEGLDNIFLEDDFTTVNLETTLTNATQKAAKKFRFKGDPSYAKILKLGGVEAVNLANNHIFDYLEQGYTDTMKNLEKQDIGYFGYENNYITTIKDVKIGVLGYEGWRDTPDIRKQIKKDIKKLQDKNVQIILVHFHWGIERSYVPTESQRTLAKFTIDSGADLILGHHPHVVQGIEEYKDKFIVYSLGNFMFGGNRNPSDKDTFVFQQTFHLKNGKLTKKKEINVVPFSISSVSTRNDYQPTLLKGSEAQRVKSKIIDASNQIDGSEWLVYEKEEKVVKEK